MKFSIAYFDTDQLGLPDLKGNLQAAPATTSCTEATSKPPVFIISSKGG